MGEEDLDSFSEHYLATLMNIIMAADNDTVEDVTTPRIRPTVMRIYPLFIFMYAMLVLLGTFMNLGMIFHIIRDKLYEDPTYAYLINIAISDIIKCLFVLPMTLAVLLIDNWIFGQFMCYFTPILQDMPIHVSMMTYLLIAGDRYRLISDPRRPRIPAFMCTIGCWFFAVCIILPHPIFTTYVDLSIYQEKHLRGLGLCVTNLTDNIDRYIRGLFVMTYIAPLTIISYIYVKSTRELETLEESPAIPTDEVPSRDRRSSPGNSVSDDDPDKRVNDESTSTSTTDGSSEDLPPHDLYHVELDVLKEKRTQKYLISMVSVFAVLFCPLMILRLAKLSVMETYENDGILDITYTILVWLAFTSTITTPGFYLAWQMSRTTKERLRHKYLCCNCRSSGKSLEEMQMTTRNSINDNTASNVAFSINLHTCNLESSNNVDHPERII